MKLSEQMGKHLREVFFGGNWTSSNLKEHLQGVTWKQAATQVYSFNSIAALLYHTGYYVRAVLDVLEGKPLDAKDEFSFNHPPVNNGDDWNALINKTLHDAESLASAVELLPEHQLNDIFSDEKYGTYYRNIQGVIEHTHYHLGQIVLIKKMVFLKDGI